MWRFLRHKPKWRDLEGAKQQRADTAKKQCSRVAKRWRDEDAELSGADDESAEIQEAFGVALEHESNSRRKRPIGRKAAKENRLADRRSGSASKARAEISEAAKSIAESLRLKNQIRVCVCAEHNLNHMVS